MQSIIPLVTINKEPRIDSRIAAEELGIEHKSFLETVRTYQTEIETLGSLHFESTIPVKGTIGGRPKTYVMLNKKHVAFALSLCLNTPATVRFKVKFFRLLDEEENAWLSIFSQDNKKTCSQQPKGKKAEKEIELALGAKLEAQGIKVQYQVECAHGIADIVTPTAIYEIKSFLSTSYLQQAIGQVLSYRSCINPLARAIVVGCQHKRGPASFNLASSLGVEVIVWHKDTSMIVATY